MGIISTPYAELKEIVLQLLVESDDNEELENRAFEIITEDGFEEYVNNIDNNSIGTILDCIQFCDSKGGTRLNNPALIRLEWGIRLFGGKTAKELRVGINDTVDNTLYYCAVGGIAGFVGGVAEIGLGFILDAALELPEERPIFMPVLGISVPVLMEGMIGVICLTEDTDIVHVVKACLDLGIIRNAAIMMTSIAAVATTLSVPMLDSDAEWKEALEYGVTVASGVGTVFALSEILTRRFFNIPNTAIQQANTNAQAADVQPAL